MGLESPTYISDFNSSNPTSGDPRSEGDDHIRNIKAAIKATFPNIAGAVGASHTTLNEIDNWVATDTITAAATTNIGAKTAILLVVSGTTQITAFDNPGTPLLRILRFAAATPLKYNATSLWLPTLADITAANGDTAFMWHEGSGNWRCIAYTRGTGASLATAAAPAGTVAAPSFSIVGDSNSGVNGDASGTIQLVSDGVSKLAVNNTSITCSDALLLQSGTVNAGDQAWCFSADTDTGMYRGAANNITIECGGDWIGYFSTSGFTFNTGLTLTADSCAITCSTLAATSSVSASTYTFEGDANTGLVNTNPDEIIVKCGGATVATIDASTADFDVAVNAQGIISTLAGATAVPGAFLASSGTFTGIVNKLEANRSASDAYYFIKSTSDADGTPDNEFVVLGNGDVGYDGTNLGTAADYAEMFEWADGNPTSEDRVGMAVTLVGEKIKVAVGNDVPIGIISGHPATLADAGELKWSGRYVKDDFGRYMLDAEGHRQQSPNFDPNAEYVPRRQRKEWAPVGLLGKLTLRKGQKTAPTWIKLTDHSPTTERWLVK